VTNDQVNVSSSKRTKPLDIKAWTIFERNLAAFEVHTPIEPHRNMPARPMSIGTESRGNTGPAQTASVTQQLFASVHEDIARLKEIFQGQPCTAIMRGMDGVVLPLDMSAPPVHSTPVDAPAFCAPIYGKDGVPLASIEVVLNDSDGSVTSAKLLRALIESSARAITERWFRVLHRYQWVLAAMRPQTPGTYILLAFDNDQQLCGTDRKARQLLETNGWRFGAPIGFPELFQPTPVQFGRRRYHDVSLTLWSSDKCEPWLALLTPPDAGAIEPGHDGHSGLHTRPRRESLLHSEAVSRTAKECRGLSAPALRRIEEYVDSHLDSALEVEELATVVRMSPSHFTRSFHKSVGLTPHKYVTRHRVMRARELLATTQLPLTEIALRLGFFDQSHLSRRFNELVGMPPGAFRVEEKQ
jgi:AraC-like DNA-binding protein